MQPASLDLHLGDHALALRCSFLPDVESTVEEKVDDLAFQRIDLRDGATLERDRPYLIPLREELALPPEVRAPHEPEELDRPPRRLHPGDHRPQPPLRRDPARLPRRALPRGRAPLVRDPGPRGPRAQPAAPRRRRRPPRRRGAAALHQQFPLLYLDSHPLRESELAIADGLFLSVDLAAGPAERVVGYRAKKNSLPIDLAKIRHYRWNEFWEPVYPEPGSRIVLEPEIFYLLLSAEGVCIPPEYAAEMMAYDPTAGELRTHYAGFFDPGFGYDSRGDRHGSRAALEVRARDVPFMVEHRQPICKLGFERLAAPPDVLYGRDLGSNYQGQVTMLSKHFEEQTAGAGADATQAPES